MTVGQLCREMDGRELAEWRAVDRYFMRLPDPWQQTGVMAASALAPYSPAGQPPKVSAVVGLAESPQHPLQVRDALARLHSELEG